jgi:hypothetical protein
MRFFAIDQVIQGKGLYVYQAKYSRETLRPLVLYKILIRKFSYYKQTDSE